MGEVGETIQGLLRPLGLIHPITEYRDVLCDTIPSIPAFPYSPNSFNSSTGTDFDAKVRKSQWPAKHKRSLISMTLTSGNIQSPTQTKISQHLTEFPTLIPLTCWRTPKIPRLTFNSSVNTLSCATENVERFDGKTTKTKTLWCQPPLAGREVVGYFLGFGSFGRYENTLPMYACHPFISIHVRNSGFRKKMKKGITRTTK